MCFPQCITECFPFVFRMFPVWFQNAFRIDRILPAFWLRKVSFPKAFHVLSECFQNTATRPRIDRTLSARFPNVFGKHSSCSRSIQGVRKAHGTQHLHIFIPNAPRARRMLPGRFPYMLYAPRMLPEYTWMPHSDGRWKLFSTCTTNCSSYRMPFRMHPYGAEQPVCYQNTPNTSRIWSVRFQNTQIPIRKTIRASVIGPLRKKIYRF